MQDRAVYSRHGFRGHSQKADSKAERAILEERGPGDAGIDQHCEEVYQEGKFELFNFPASVSLIRSPFLSLQLALSP